MLLITKPIQLRFSCEILWAHPAYNNSTTEGKDMY